MHGDGRWAQTLRKCAEAREAFLASLEHPELYLELMEMKRVDQEYRSSMHVLPAPKDANAGKESEQGHDHEHSHGEHAHDSEHSHGGEHAHGMNVDERHTARMKEIVKQHGWPTNSMVGSDGATAAWLLVQHADHDPKFQRHCLELMKKVPAGEVSTVDLAYLTDRVLVNEGKKQLYGTQFWMQNGKPGPAPDRGRGEPREAAQGGGHDLVRRVPAAHGRAARPLSRPAGGAPVQREPDPFGSARRSSSASFNRTLRT